MWTTAQSKKTFNCRNRWTFETRPSFFCRSLGALSAQGVSVGKIRTCASRRRACSSRHHGWWAPPEAKFFPARPLATIQTLAKWPKIRGLELAQDRRFLAGHFFLMCGLFLRHWLNGLQTNLPACSLENDDIIVAVGIRGKNQEKNLKAIAPTEAFRL